MIQSVDKSGELLQVPTNLGVLLWPGLGKFTEHLELKCHHLQLLVVRECILRR